VVRDVLTDGAAWFYEMQNSGWTEVFKCRLMGFIKDHLILNQVMALFCDLELWERPLALSVGDIRMAGRQSLADIALNKEWPKHDAD
jgi:hypothetical protein